MPDPLFTPTGVIIFKSFAPYSLTRIFIMHFIILLFRTWTSCHTYLSILLILFECFLAGFVDSISGCGGINPFLFYCLWGCRLILRWEQTNSNLIWQLYCIDQLLQGGLIKLNDLGGICIHSHRGCIGTLSIQQLSQAFFLPHSVFCCYFCVRLHCPNFLSRGSNG